MPSKNSESVSSCYERTFKSLDILATSSGTLRDRLANLAVSGLGLLDERDYPSDLREKFRAIKASLSALGTFDVSVQVMTDQDAERVASKIFELACEVIERDAVEATND